MGRGKTRVVMGSRNRVVTGSRNRVIIRSRHRVVMGLHSFDKIISFN